MKQYRKKQSLSRQSASKCAPIYFELDAINDPAVGVEVALVYDHEGNYLGFAKPEAIKKYLYGQLYYKTKKAYGINLHCHFRRGIKYVIEKVTSNVALYIRMTTLTTRDLLDEDAPGFQAKCTLERFRGVNIYALQGVSDPYGLITNINEEMRAEAEALCEKYTNRIRESLEAQIRGEEDLLAVADMIIARSE